MGTNKDESSLVPAGALRRSVGFYGLLTIFAKS